jgi:dTDP-4-amino-4,6-dideoxygalactose transaminase
MDIIPHNQLLHGDEEVIAVSEVVRSGTWAGSPLIDSVESRFASVVGIKHAVAVGTGLGALRIALRAIGIGQGDAVAVPGYSCVALANAVLSCGADPIPVEIDRNTLNICPEALMEMVKANNHRIRAAIAVHTFGCPADMDKLAEAGVPLIEDCSHAFGRSGFGSQGRVALMSLYATKLVGAGEGGMIFTNDSSIMEKILHARDYTDLPPDGGRLNDKPSSFTAAIAGCQLDRLPGFLARRDHLAERYYNALGGLADEGLCRLPFKKSGRVWYRYTLQLPRDVDEVILAMRACGVVSARPVEPWCEPPGKYCAEAFSQTISLPIYPALTDGMQDRVVNTFLQAIL